MSKFKVGDQVKYVGSVYRHLLTGAVVSYLAGVEYPYGVSSDSGTGVRPCSEDELELVEVVPRPTTRPEGFVPPCPIGNMKYLQELADE